MPQPSHGFASYLLTKGGCWTELAQGEAIMGASVLSVDEQQDEALSHGFDIHVVASHDDQPPLVINNDSQQHQITIDASQLPKTLSLQLLPRQALPAPLQDYQWVMDILASEHEESPATAFFINGACDNKKRVAGRTFDKVELTIRSLPTTIVAGWAPGHEAVKLVPSLVFVAAEGDVHESMAMAAAAAAAAESDAANVATNHIDEEPPAAAATTTKRHVISVDDLATPEIKVLLSPEACRVEQLADAAYLLQKHSFVVSTSKEYTLALDETSSSVVSQAVLKFKEQGGDEPPPPPPPTAYQIVLQSSQGASFENGSCESKSRVLIKRDAGNRQEPWPALVVHDATKPIFVTGLLSIPNETTSGQQTVVYRTKPLTLNVDPQKLVDSRHHVEATIQRQIHRQAGVKRELGNERAVPSGKEHDQHANHDGKYNNNYNKSKQHLHRHGFVGGSSWYIGMLVLLAGPCFVLPLCLHLSQQSTRRKGRIRKAN